MKGLLCSGIIAWSVGFLGASEYTHPWLESTEASLRENMDRLSPNSLNRYGGCKYAQFGEDGVIEEIFRRLNITKGFFVEFGAGDGIFISNTRKLYEEGWSGCYIEPDKPRYDKLVNNYKGEKSILCLSDFVTWHKEDPRGMLFDEIKEKHFPKEEIDFLSIDIDSGDYYVLEGLKCRPKVICVESCFHWHPLCYKKIPEEIAVANFNNQPLQVYIDLAMDMGYRPVCMTLNLFLVRNDLADSFDETPTDALTLWRDAFRALPHKEVVINRRINNPLFVKLEGEELSLNNPITLDF